MKEKIKQDMQRSWYEKKILDFVLGFVWGMATTAFIVYAILCGFAS